MCPSTKTRRFCDSKTRKSRGRRGGIVYICADMHHFLNIRAHTRIYVVNLADMSTAR